MHLIVRQIVIYIELGNLQYKYKRNSRTTINNSRRHEEIEQEYEEIDLVNKNQIKTNKDMKNPWNIWFKLMVRRRQEYFYHKNSLKGPYD